MLVKVYKEDATPTCPKTAWYQ